VSWAHGINSLTATPGYEFNLALAAMAVVIVALGAGRLSVDAVIARHLRSAAPPPRPASAEGSPPPAVDGAQVTAARSAG
jgi:hypothetical protein